jgi:hypothetical protein
MYRQQQFISASPARSGLRRSSFSSLSPADLKNRSDPCLPTTRSSWASRQLASDANALRPAFIQLRNTRSSWLSIRTQ